MPRIPAARACHALRDIAELVGPQGGDEERADRDPVRRGDFGGLQVQVGASGRCEEVNEGAED